MTQRTTLAGLVAACVAFGACRRPAPRPEVPEPPPAVATWRAWTTTLDGVQEAIRRGSGTAAESQLDAFRARFPGTQESAEALYWRGVVRADPQSGVGTTRDAVADLSAYEAGGPVLGNHVEAGVLRRLLLQRDSIRVVLTAERAALGHAQAAAAAAALATRDSLRVRDEEQAKLRTELEQTRAELERVRQRLAPPRRP